MRENLGKHSVDKGIGKLQAECRTSHLYKQSGAEEDIHLYPGGQDGNRLLRHHVGLVHLLHHRHAGGGSHPQGTRDPNKGYQAPRLQW